MFDNKTQILFPSRKTEETIEFNNQKIKVNPFMNKEEQAILISVYLTALFKETTEPKYNLINAKNSLIASILDIMTDIDLPENSMNDILANPELLKAVESKIVNIDDFYQRLYGTVEMTKDNEALKKSIGSVLESLFSKVSGFLETMSTTEGLDDKIKSIRELLTETQNSPLIKDTIDTFKGSDKV